MESAASSNPRSSRSSPRFRSSPIYLIFSDLWLILRRLRWLLNIIYPFHFHLNDAELNISQSRNVVELLLHAIIGVLDGLILLFLIPLMIAAPFSLLLLYLVLCGSILKALYRLLLNRDLEISSDDMGVENQYTNGPEEEWVFINGISIGDHWLKANVHLISKIFRRRVIGIHNITYGALFDLIECVVQRCFLYATKDTRYVYRRLSEILQKPEVHKLVVIVHSQGGIILSNVVDMILADCRPEILKKMEVYTFGNAANHFNNPMVANDPLYHIEHFCNEHDFVARIGTIAGINEAQEDVKYYVGKVVLYLQRSGHLMNQHYLHPMFIDGQFGSRSSGLVSDVDESNSRLCEYLPRA